MSDSSNESPTHRGVVKWFNDAKGYGFIEHVDGKDVFVHYSVIESDGFKTLRDGEEVVYEFREGPKGLQAVKVARTARSGSEAESAEGANGEMADAMVSESMVPESEAAGSGAPASEIEASERTLKGGATSANPDLLGESEAQDSLAHSH